MKNNTIKFVIRDEDVGKRLDILLLKIIKQTSRSSLKKIIQSKKVSINGKIVKLPSYKVKLEDKITVNFEIEQNTYLKPFKYKIDIVYEDKDILIINKPVGMVVHPGAGNFEKTLVNALLFKYKNKLSDINGSSRPGIVHRIDKDTSGLLVVAKNNSSHSNLGNQFDNHSIRRIYYGMIWGVLRPLSGKIESLITRNRKNRKLMMVSDSVGKKAITNYSTLKVFDFKDIPKVSLIQFKLETGRTHQIRVHMKYKRTFLLGDKQYGKKNIKFKKVDKKFEEKLNLLKGQALHAYLLGFEHPTKRKYMEFKSEIPGDFKNLLNFLQNLHN